MKYLGLSVKRILLFHIRTKTSLLFYFLKYTLPNQGALRAIRQLKGSKRGKNAFVFANGPSMNKLDTSKVKLYVNDGFDIFGVNSYIHSKLSDELRPNYYVLSDPAYFGKDLHLLTKERQKEVNDDFEKIRNMRIHLFAPLQYCRQVASNEAYNFFCDSENLFSMNVSDVTRPRGYVSMTAYKALSIACYMGYDNIYICGFDNNYFKTIIVDENNEMYYEEVPFFSCGHSNRLIKIRNFQGNDIGEVLYDFHFLFKGLAKFAQMPIVNLDKESLVDCFSKKHSLDLYKSCGELWKQNDRV